LSSCQKEKKSLIHDTLLSVVVGILHWVELVHKTWLLCGSRVIITVSGVGGTNGTSFVFIVSGSVVVTMSTVSAITSLFLSERSGARSTVTTKGATNRSWFALECISALFTTSERSSLLLELRHGDSWKCRGSVVLGLVVVDLVDWDSGVNNTWLDSLTLNHWLDVLVNMMVNMLTSNGWVY